MNEKEVTEQTVGTVQTENVPDQTDNSPNQPEQELTPEEKLKLREKQLEERENALIIREQTMNVSKMLSDNNYPPELAELLRIDTDGEKNAETVKKAVEILNNRSRPIATVSTGIDHSSPSLVSSYDNSDFMRGFNR